MRHGGAQRRYEYFIDVLSATNSGTFYAYDLFNRNAPHMRPVDDSLTSLTTARSACPEELARDAQRLRVCASRASLCTSVASDFRHKFRAFAETMTN